MSEAHLELRAARRYGVFTRAQALAEGMTPTQIARRLADGRWRARYRGVYLLRGVPRSHEQEVMAACSWAGRGSGGFGPTAGEIWQLPDVRSARLHVYCPRGRRSVPRVQFHRSPSIRPEDIVLCRALPITSIERTLLDIGPFVGREGLEVALDDALNRRLTELNQLTSFLDRAGGLGRRGAALLGEVLHSRDPRARPSASPLETKVRRVIESSHLPRGTAQFVTYHRGQRLRRVDYAYPEYGVLIEDDSRRRHFEWADAKRDMRQRNVLVNLGYTVLVFNWEDATRRPAYIVEQVETALRRAGWPGASTWPGPFEQAASHDIPKSSRFGA